MKQACNSAVATRLDEQASSFTSYDQVQRATGTSTAVAEALLRHFGHSPEAAISQFQVGGLSKTSLNEDEGGYDNDNI